MTDQQKEESTPTPYKGQYRKDVYEDDPKNADDIEDPVPTATQKNLMGFWVWFLLENLLQFYLLENYNPF